MRAFWALILIALAGGGIFLYMSARTQARQALTAAVAAQEQALLAAEQATLAAQNAAGATPKSPESSAAEAKPAELPSASLSPAETDKSQRVPRTGESFDASAPKAEAAGATPAAPTTPAASAAADSALPKAATPPPASNKSSTPTFETVPQTIETKEDGTLLIDNKFVVKGDGSAEMPYEVTWELLLSAEGTYVPSEKKNKIPQGVAMLDGKHVKIGGYIAFPLMVNSPKELLSMLNQWDGCCIGVPPTPYDAIEVRLKQSVTGDDKYATTGTLSGVFGVKPYLVGDWLVGLYIMDGAALTVEKFGGFGN